MQAICRDRNRGVYLRPAAFVDLVIGLAAGAVKLEANAVAAAEAKADFAGDDD